MSLPPETRDVSWLIVFGLGLSPPITDRAQTSELVLPSSSSTSSAQSSKVGPELGVSQSPSLAPVLQNAIHSLQLRPLVAVLSDH